MCPNKPVKNPFEGQRWEQDSENIIHLPEIFPELEKKHDLYLLGSRGTGKTTFLKALNWETRIQNPSIQMQIKKEDLFKDKYIAIYINAMSFGDSIFERDFDDDSFMRLYSLWAETNVLYRVIEAIEGLYNENYIDFSINYEQEQCNKIYDYLMTQFDSILLSEGKNTDIEYSITSLAEIIDLLRSKIVDERNNSRQKYESYSYGTVLKATIPYLMNLCSEKGKSDWYTKICFDQIESAPNFQMIANTLVVKKLSDQIWFIVSGLNHLDIETNKTYIPNHNLTDDDRKFIDLDNVFFTSSSAKTGAFYALAEGICDLRLKHSDNTIDRNEKFNLTRHLGSWEMNQILDVFLRSREKTSVNNDFKTFMSLVRENHEKNKYLTDQPPYIDTYYYDVLKFIPRWKGKLQKSREKNSDTGKKYVVIMMSLLRDYKFQGSTPYVGIRQIISLCNTTRDFLKIMKALFDARIKNKRDYKASSFFAYEASFTHSEIKTQTKAVLNVADDKYNSIEHKYGDKATERMRAFIDTCGEILYNIQSRKDLSSLSSEEKGIFTVSIMCDDEDSYKLYEFLKTANADTYIHITDENPKNEYNAKTVNFELSKLFAPKYKVSFRKIQGKSNNNRMIFLNDIKLKQLCLNKEKSFTNATAALLEDAEKTLLVDAKSNTKTNKQQKLF